MGGDRPSVTTGEPLYSRKLPRPGEADMKGWKMPVLFRDDGSVARTLWEKSEEMVRGLSSELRGRGGAMAAARIDGDG